MSLAQHSEEMNVPTGTLPRTYAELKAQLQADASVASHGGSGELWMLQDLVESCCQNLPAGSIIDPEEIYCRILRLPNFSSGVYSSLGYALGRVNQLAADLEGKTQPEDNPEIVSLITDVCDGQVRAKILPLLQKVAAVSGHRIQEEGEPANGRHITDAEIVAEREFHSAGEQTAYCGEILGVQLQDGEAFRILGEDRGQIVVQFFPGSDVAQQYWMAREQVCAIAVREEMGT